MKILYFELRKEFIRKSFFFMMIILVIINFFWLEWDYHTNGGFTEDYVKVNASEKENKYYEELHQYLDGKLNAEKVSYVSEEYQRYHNLVSGDYSTEYDSSMHTGYAFGDYSLLTVHFYNPIKYLTCELKVCITKKPWNPTVPLALPAAPELSALCVIRVPALKGGKNVSGNNA